MSNKLNPLPRLINFIFRQIPGFLNKSCQNISGITFHCVNNSYLQMPLNSKLI